MEGESEGNRRRSGDDLLEQLKQTAPERERLAAARWATRWRVAGIAVAVTVVGLIAGSSVYRALAPAPAVHLPARVGDLPRIQTPAVQAQADELVGTFSRDVEKVQVAGAAVYGTDPSHPQVLVVLLHAQHVADDVTGIRAGLEAPILGSGASTPDGPHIRSATVNGVDFVCEPVVENGEHGPVGERTDCTWDDRDHGVGLVIDFYSGESDIVLHEVEAMQPGAIT